MNKEIKFNGFSTQPSDYLAPDGELAAALDIINEDGALKAIPQPQEKFRLQEGQTVLAIHNTSAFKHYIIGSTTQTSYTPAWIDGTDTNHTQTNFDKEVTGVKSVCAIGNTLVFLCEDGIHYFLWKNDNKGSYKYLGNHIPELPLSFGLQGVVPSTESIGTATIGGDDYTTDSFKTELTNHVFASINSFIASKYTNGHRFIFPFFVRYALRLYDGSLTMHSAPILMCCGSKQCIYVLTGEDFTLNRERTKGIFPASSIYAATFGLDFAVFNQSYIVALQEWSDIVTSVDIFISEPLYPIDLAGKVGTRLKTASKVDFGYCVCKYYGQDVYSHNGGNSPFCSYYQYHSVINIFQYSHKNVPRYSLPLPLKGYEARVEEICNKSLFYFLKSYKLNELSTDRKIVEIKDGYLSSLSTKERMTDDYDSHSTLTAEHAFEYNSRLNLVGVSKVMPYAFHMASMLNFTNGYLYPNDEITSINYSLETYKEKISLLVYIKKSEKNIVVRSYDFQLNSSNQWRSEAEFGYMTPAPFIYYPDANAYKAVIRRFAGGYSNSEFTLTPHSTLNGAYFFNDWAIDPGDSVLDEDIEGADAGDNEADRAIPLPNKLYTSEINNPFLFPASGINTIGTGTILNVSSATKALSQGQFGQFPLYAFTTDGVWALEVSSTGTFSAKQPITRDVVLGEGQSITQLDNSVAFATERGIMLISGSETVCISDSIEDNNLVTAELPHFDKITEQGSVTVPEDFDNGTTTTGTFLQFIQNCEMIYDYAHQRIIVFNKGYKFAYVYSIKTKTWGMMSSNIYSRINSYPDALAVDNDSKVVSFSEELFPQNSGVKGLIITRPLKLDSPDTLKTIYDIIVRGIFRKGNVKTALYGSKDLMNWQYIASSTSHHIRNIAGTPYKYFRLVMLTDLSATELIHGCSVRYNERLTNKLR